MSNTRNGDPKRAVAYVRASTTEQHLGPEAQRAAIQSWAAASGVNIVAWQIDQGISGGKDLDDRPGLVAALGELRIQRAGLLVVARRDRLARDVYVAATIQRAVERGGARVVAADGVGNGETPADAFMRTILDAAAQYERALIRARTCAALQTKRASGYRIGTVPFGFKADAAGRLRRCRNEQAIIDAVLRLRRDGHSLRSIVRTCESRGLHARTGRPLQLVQIARIVRANAESDKAT